MAAVTVSAPSLPSRGPVTGRPCCVDPPVILKVSTVDHDDRESKRSRAEFQGGARKWGEKKSIHHVIVSGGVSSKMESAQQDKKARCVVIKIRGEKKMGGKLAVFSGVSFFGAKIVLCM